jgi:spore maturation protein CgeB
VAVTIIGQIAKLSMMLRVLFVGENWFGSCARACCYALRRLDCNVLDLDAQTFFPRLGMKSSRAALRLAAPRLIKEYNQQLIEVAEHFQPDFLLAFKGTYVLAQTLRELRRRGIAIYNYYPDRMLLARGTPLEQAISEYDCVFDTKRYWDGDTAQRYRVRNRVFLAHGYDPEIHRPVELDERDRQQFACDVSLIATHMPVKQEVVSALARLRPHLDLHIWGNQWDEYCRSAEVRKRVRGPAVNGVSYAKAVRASRINLALMGVTPEARDETSTRTYEIPACGGFMLHPRTPEVQELFEEDREIACFGSVEELAQKIDDYLVRPEERKAIARAGHLRCVPAYSYEQRMAEILRWHQQRNNGFLQPRQIATAMS